MLRIFHPVWHQSYVFSTPFFCRIHNFLVTGGVAFYLHINFHLYYFNRFSQVRSNIDSVFKFPNTLSNVDYFVFVVLQNIDIPCLDRLELSSLKTNFSFISWISKLISLLLEESHEFRYTSYLCVVLSAILQVMLFRIMLIQSSFIVLIILSTDSLMLHHWCPFTISVPFILLQFLF